MSLSLIGFHCFSSVDVPKRSNSVKMKALGIFPGAKVIRGQNWDFGTQDGKPRPIFFFYMYMKSSK